MSNEQWHAEIEINDALVAACLRTQFANSFEMNSLKCIGQGWDNIVYLVNNEFIFRFPRRHIAVQLIERENAVLAGVQFINHIAIPRPIYHGNPCAEYPYPFHGYKMLKGVSGCHAALSESERVDSLPALALFLKQLHTVDTQTTFAQTVKAIVYNRMDFQQTSAHLTERVDKINDRGICAINADVYQAELVQASQAELNPDETVLVHGDLYCRHLLFDHGKLSGIIDWGDCALNHRAVDLAVIWSFYPSSCHQHFFDLYCDVDKGSWQYARFLGIHSALTILLYGHDIGDALLVEEAKASLLRINPMLIR
jgi:aminoglycoside phosphotransferase (APT) family kinase protein